MNPCRRQHGFTLIELIVVIAILALLSVISYRAITTALDTRMAVARTNENLREFELGLFILSKDLKQMQRSPLPVGGKAFVLGNAVGNGKKALTEGELFRFYRSADAEMLRGITRVSYVLHDGKLTQQLSSPVDKQTFSTPVMGRIQSALVSLFDAQGNQPAVWPDGQIPTVIEIRLQHQRYGEVIIREAIL